MMNSIGPGGSYVTKGGIPDLILIIVLPISGNSYFDFTSTHDILGLNPFKKADNMIIIRIIFPGVRYILRGIIPCKSLIGAFSKSGDSYFDYTSKNDLVEYKSYNMMGNIFMVGGVGPGIRYSIIEDFPCQF